MLLATWLTAALAASPGSEVALILDNSCSMVAGGVVQGTREKLPANDPERAAVLGALLVDGLIRGSEDQLTVIGFGDKRNQPARVVQGSDAVRALPYGGGTWFAPALTAARGVLDASPRQGRLVILFTDGTPSDVDTSDEVARALGGADVLAVGLFGSDSASAMGQGFLRGVVADPADLTLVDATAPDAVQRTVEAFTGAYARRLGSKPLTGALADGASLSLDVGRYVTEVLVATASARPGAPFRATLTGPTGDVPTRASGDNGCPSGVAPSDAPTICAPPRRHYATFRAANDPYQESRWTLTASGGGEVQYGVILRYDLTAELDLPPAARLGDAVPLQARLLFRGQVFQDDAFFAADGLVTEVVVGDEQVPLRHAGAGRLEGTWTPSTPGAFTAELRVRNAWLDLRDRDPVSVEGFVDLTLRPTPSPLVLGTWRGARGRTERCGEFDLSGSQGADRVAVTCTPGATPDGVQVTCAPVPGSEAPGGGQPLRWRVCAQTAPCCGDAAGPVTVTLVGAHPHYADGAVAVPVTFEVSATGWLRCWWVELALALGSALTAFIAWGFLSPNSFDPAMTVRLAGSEAGLRRASALVLCEQPGGRRGWYRHARFGVNGEGNPVRDPGAASLVVVAGRGGSTIFRKAPGLERMDRRTRKLVPVNDDELASGPERGVAYRVGSLWLRFD